MFLDVPKEKIQSIKENKNVSETYLAENLGYSYFKDSHNEYKPYFSLLAVSDDFLSNMAIKLKEGRLPENSSEIVVPYHTYTNGGVRFNVGEEITLDISKRKTLSGEELNQNNPLDEEVEETLEKMYTKTFKIVGIIERPNYNIEGYSAPGYTIITKLEDISAKANIAVKYKDSKNYKEKTKEISNNGEILYINNLQLLRFEGSALSDSTMQTLYSIAGVIMAIILVSSVFVIKNGFAISITDRLKQYGMLASIGTTKKQIKKSVYFEGFILGAIAIPIGIISGIVAIIILLNVINYILRDYLNDFSFIYNISAGAILISAFIAIITIYLSCISSARRASKVTPIELIRNSGDIKIKKNKIKCPKIINKLFNIGGEIAYKNLKRSKKKYRATIVSLVVSIVTFIAISSFIDYGFKMSNVYYQELGYNFVIFHSGKEDTETFSQIAKLKDIGEYSIQRYDYMELDYTKYYSDFANKVFKDWIDEEYKEQIKIMSIGDEYYKKFVSEIGANYEECKERRYFN